MSPTCCQWITPHYKWDNGIANKIDPIQGPAPNCAIIAALSAIAFVQPTYLKKTPDSNGNYWIPVDRKFYVLNPYVCDGLSAYFWDVLWPAIWEKAYAAYKLQMKANTPITNDQLDGICKIDWEIGPLGALELFLGRKGMGVARTVAQLDPGEILAEIKGYGYECGVGSGSWKVSKKMVAWTYFALDYPWDETISANHSYTLLGIVNDAAGNPYIVLRNPVDYCTPLAGAPTTWCSETIDGRNGQIAVPLNLFHQVFEGYGWV
jgi:hypothetical protein